MKDLRLRQLVIAANSLEAADHLADILALGEPYPDPGVGEFGLENAVFAIGDQFLEVIVPTTEDAPARRFIDRFGEGGYMVIFQVPEIGVTRARADDMGLRRVWNSDFDEISASHLHPADIGGAIVSFDQPKPPESWRWGGPDWEENSVPGALAGAHITCPEPAKTADRWAAVFGSAPSAEGAVQTCEAELTFSAASQSKVTRFTLKLKDPSACLQRARALGCETTQDSFHLAGTQIQLSEL